ncbi:LexA family transcriptional regulator [Polynucleobacter paneuropaeus]|nr:LexA family transcriptional regulator [Polynucleobacter paneuropaeus]
MNIADNRRQKLKEWFFSRSIPEKEKSYISQLINGKASFGEKAARRLEATYGMPIKFLDLGALSSKEIDIESNPDYPAVQKVRIKVSAGITGYGIDSYEDDGSMIVFKADWYRDNKFNPEKLIALTVSGDSMIPTLYDGDTVVINTADTDLKDGEVFVFNLDGEIVIKRAVRDSGQWWLDSDNKNNTRFTRKSCPDRICIPIGKVVQKQSMRI